MTADGKLRTAGPTEHSDLFWAAPCMCRHYWKAGWQRRLDAADDDRNVRWARELYAAMAYGVNYDPTNFFRSNQNVASAG